MSHISLSANTCWYIVNFRLPLIKELLALGHTVTVFAPRDRFTVQLQDAGVNFVNLHIASRSVNPAKEFRCLFRYIRLYGTHDIDVALHFTPKPNIYGSFAAMLHGKQAINNISGLGSGVESGRFLRRLVEALYRFSQRSASTVFVQNPDDLRLFMEKRIASAEQLRLLPGSGVDLEHFSYREPVERDVTAFTLVARLLWAKGVVDFLEAARRVKKLRPGTRFLLVGGVEETNPRYVPSSTLQAYVSEGTMEWIGHVDDVRTYLTDADCVVLPSVYREGTPKSLLEAASMGRIIITNDTPGCRETVDDEVSGFICRPRDLNDLVDKMLTVCDLSHETRIRMSLAARQKMESEYSVANVHDAYFEALARAFPARASGGTSA